jgi:hypothetical protein
MRSLARAYQKGFTLIVQRMTQHKTVSIFRAYRLCQCGMARFAG